MQLLTFNPATNLVDLIEYHGRIRPRAEALVIEGNRQSWGDFSANVNRIANRLLAMGVGKGDKVAVLARGSADYFNTFFGILTAGACAVPLSGMATAETIALMVNDCDAKVLLISEDMRGLIDPVNDELTKLIDGGRIGFDFADDTWQGFAGWVGDASEEFPNIEILPEDDFNIIYSSGTTGVPKGILHSRHAPVLLGRARCCGLQCLYPVPAVDADLFQHHAVCDAARGGLGRHGDPYAQVRCGDLFGAGEHRAANAHDSGARAISAPLCAPGF